jgi:hypothetical protein
MTSQNSDGSGYHYEGYENAEGYNSGNSSDEGDPEFLLTEEGTGDGSELDFSRTYSGAGGGGGGGEDFGGTFSSSGSVRGLRSNPSVATLSRAPAADLYFEDGTQEGDPTTPEEGTSPSPSPSEEGGQGDTCIDSDFDSAALLVSESAAPSKSLMIFKRGDDLRQDYVVQTMFYIFNRLWSLSPMRHKPFIHQYK